MMAMRLRVLMPNRILMDREVVAVNAEGPAGAFGLLPRHVDIATALVTGLLSYRTADGGEGFVATDGGILVKQGDTVTVSTRHAVEGAALGKLNDLVMSEFAELDDHERKVRSAVAYLEHDLMRRINALSRREAPL